MSSLKEVKNRITSIGTTRKITQARRMISSAKLHKAQGEMERSDIYMDSLERMFERVAHTIAAYKPLDEINKVANGKHAIVVFSSDSGMCGSFNSKMDKHIEKMVERYGRSLELLFYPIGKKIGESLVKRRLTVVRSLSPDKMSHKDVEILVGELNEKFTKGEITEAQVVYYDFRGLSSQNITQFQLLPLVMPQVVATEDNSSTQEEFIFEPSEAAVGEALLPMILKAKLHRALTSNRAAEHATRMIAMQLATENADELIDHLQQTYNKLRQQNITSELLDIVGGSFA